MDICTDCYNTGVVLEHDSRCMRDTSLGDCCYYREKYCSCNYGRALKERES